MLSSEHVFPAKICIHKSCVCVVLQEACQLEDSSVVSNWGGDAVSSPPTLMSWGGGGMQGDSVVGSLSTLSDLGLILIH